MNIVLVEEDGNPRSFEAQPGESIYNVLARNGISLSAPCGGRGRCGKCRIQLQYTGADEIVQTVLACQVVPEKDCEIRLADAKNRILTQGRRLSFESDRRNGYAISVDIGTTTIAAYLLDLKSGEQLAAASYLNPQRIHGADVISRISFACKSKENSLLLQEEMIALLYQAQCDLLQSAGLTEDTDIGIRTLVGNTAMMHLTGGFDTSGIAKAPYLPEYTCTHMQTLNKDCFMFGGCVSGYVGADTLAAMLACDLKSATDNVLLIDIGTNGEIVLKSHGKYRCCSCAAGPAFEGAHIECGTGAVSGAIDHLYADGSGYRYTTIDEAQPQGICGSGLVDAIAYLLDQGLINALGRMHERFYINKDVYINPADVREVQLAKAAIAAGIEILANRAGLEISQIDRVLLAGGFGNYIDVHSACAIGLLPAELESRVMTVGNAAGDGSKMMALSQKALRDLELLRKETEYIELSAQEDFEDVYTDKLIFETD